MSSPTWHSLSVTPADLRLDTTLNCGQSFRWTKTADNEWTSVLKNHIITLRQTEDDVHFRTYAGNAEEQVHSLLRDYFQLDVDLKVLYERWIEDGNFKQKAGSFMGIRILRQDPVENVFSFICTSNNNIQRITMMIDKLCKTFGQEVGSIPTSSSTTTTYHAFPTISRLAEDGVEEELRKLGFGYRAKYISQTARYIMEHHDEQWLDKLRELDYDTCKTELMKLAGVGPKVADCICLMSMDKTGAIPVDTHVWQIAKRDYKLPLQTSKTLTPKIYLTIGDRFRAIFGEYAGWAHSVLFTADLRQFGDRLVEEGKGTLDALPKRKKRNNENHVVKVKEELKVEVEEMKGEDGEGVRITRSKRRKVGKSKNIMKM